MKQATMKIQKGDVPVILLSALGGFLLVFFSLVGKNLGTAVFVGLVFGVPSGNAANEPLVNCTTCPASVGRIGIAVR